MRHPSLAALALTAVAIVTTACAPQAQPQSSDPPHPAIAHVHGIESAPSGGILVATHSGVFQLTGDALDGPLGGHDFDAMGFTVTGTALFASGHPGHSTPPELGTPNLGVIRSDDGGSSWAPVAFTGEADFHVLTAGPDGTLYGIATHVPELLVSQDAGESWSVTASLSAVDLVATEQGLVAATEQGLQSSTDDGQTFTPLEASPLLYTVDAFSSGALVGVDTDNAVQRQAPDGSWEQVGEVVGVASALSVIDGDRVLLADDRGIVELTEAGAEVLLPAP